MTDIRIGHGYDVHAFEEGDHLMLGGVRVPHDRAFKAHSDGDVLIHALCDALLGAAALGDIGRHFPDSDPRFKGIDSLQLLTRVVKLAYRQGLRLGNADVTVIAERPKLAPHFESMRRKLAEVCRVAPHAINLKGTTTEKMGFAGREEGIAAHAVVLLTKAASQPPSV